MRSHSTEFEAVAHPSKDHHRAAGKDEVKSLLVKN